MHRMNLGVLLLSIFALIHVPSAMAADPLTPGTPRVQPRLDPIAAMPKFQCSIAPPEAPSQAPRHYQVTSITIRRESGASTHDVNVVVRLGTQTSGRALAAVCTNKFVNNQITLNPVAIHPPIRDPNYIWLCNAVASGKCRADQPPPGPQTPCAPK